MYAFFDKFGKKVLAVVGALLILAFLLPPSFTGVGGPGSSGHKIGAINGQPVYSLDAQNAVARLQHLNVLVRAATDPRTGIPREATIPELLFDSVRPQLSAQLQQNPLQWYLLLHEARSGGVGVSEDVINDILSDPTRYKDASGNLLPLSKGFNPNILNQLRDELRDALAVRMYVERGVGSIKISKPLVDDQLARMQQQVQVRVAVVEPAAFAGEIKSVSDEELRLQFDAFASTVPGTIDKDRNPFGFGYRIPDRVRVQYVSVPRAEVERAVIASKSPSLWEEDAIMYHTRHPDEFPTTQPETKPGEAPSTQPAAKPTTRPFAEARADVLSAMREPLIDQKQQAVINRLSQQLAADYQKATSPAKGKPAPTTQEAEAAKTTYGVAYGSFEYLQKLADDIQRQFGVKVSVVNQPGLLSADQINALQGLGLTYVEEPADPTRSFRGAGEYLIQSIRPLLSGEAAQKPGVIDLLQPSRVIRGLDGSAHIARVLEAEQSHPPRTLDEVKAQVEKDVRTKLAFGKAVEAGEKILAAAKQAGGLQNAPGAGLVQTTKPFDASGTDIGLPGAEEWGDQLVKPAFDLLRDVKSASQLPIYSVVKLQRANKVVVAQLIDVKTQLSTEIETMQRLRAEGEVVDSLMRGVSMDQWFSLDAVERRVGFKAEQVSDAPAPKEPGPRPMNPFAP